MTYTIRQHIPGFIDVDEPFKPAEFSTYEELIAIPFVKHWMKPMNGGDFLRFELDTYSKEEDILLGIWTDYHWVIGYITPPMENSMEELTVKDK